MKKLVSTLKGIGCLIISCAGIVSWLLRALLSLITGLLVIGAITATVIYIKVRPELDHCREVAYDTLAQMDYSDFRMLSDTEIYDSKGRLIGLINAGHYEYAPISEISLNIQNAYIAQEDRRFKYHTGVDWIATTRAAIALVKNRGNITQGGSTITQQVIKNTFLTQEQSFTRKVVEILLAPELEKKFTKANIMEFYCNTNFYGNHCYGVQAASRYYFGKDASDIEVYEAAVLAGLSNSPSAYDPIKHPAESLEKRNSVLTSMLEAGYLSQEEYEYAISRPLSIVQEEGEGTMENYQTGYALHCAAMELLKADHFKFQYTFDTQAEYDEYTEKFQEAYSEKSDLLRAGGYRIYTSLESSLQQTMQDQIDASLSGFTELQENGKYALQGAGVIIDNKTNYVVAIVGGRGTDDYFNRAYLSARQPGSTIKPLLVYAPAFDTGRYYPSRLINDHQFEGGPSNSSGAYFGPITIRNALNRSLNTVAWQILDDIGISYGLGYLGSMDFQKISWVDSTVSSLAVGGFTNGLRVVDMAKGYSTLACGGVYNDRTCILHIYHEQDGDIMRKNTEHARQIYNQDTAYMITDILKGTMSSSIGTGYGLGLSNSMPCAGKTGTTNSSKDTWFCGYTKYYTMAVWVGYDTPRAMPGIYGSTYAGRIWKYTMDKIHEDLEPEDWEMPLTVSYDIDPVSGVEDLVGANTNFLSAEEVFSGWGFSLEDYLSEQADEDEESEEDEDTEDADDETASETEPILHKISGPASSYGPGVQPQQQSQSSASPRPGASPDGGKKNVITAPTQSSDNDDNDVTDGPGR